MADKNNADKNIIGKILYTQEDITKRAKEIAKQIDKDYEGEELILLGTLKGSIPWFTDILKYTTIDTRIDFITASSYGSSMTSSGIVKITFDPQINMYNKHVLIVEDIIDMNSDLTSMGYNMIEDKESFKDIALEYLNEREYTKTGEVYYESNF